MPTERYREGSTENGCSRADTFSLCIKNSSRSILRPAPPTVLAQRIAASIGLTAPTSERFCTNQQSESSAGHLKQQSAVHTMDEARHNTSRSTCAEKHTTTCDVPCCSPLHVAEIRISNPPVFLPPRTRSPLHKRGSKPVRLDHPNLLTSSGSDLSATMRR